MATWPQKNSLQKTSVRHKMSRRTKKTIAKNKIAFDFPELSFEVPSRKAPYFFSNFSSYHWCLFLIARITKINGTEAQSPKHMQAR